MKPIIAVDGGGTKTIMAIFHPCGQLLFLKKTHGSNLQSKGEDHVKCVLVELFEDAKKNLNLSNQDFSYAYLGLSGADMSEDFLVLTRVCQEVFESIPYKIVNDAWIVMRSGLSTSYGAVAICGTGTNSAAINQKGKTAILRALGYSTGTYGGGLDIMREAFHAIYRADELTGEPTTLTEKIVKYLNVKDLNTLVSLLFPKITLQRDVQGMITELVFDAAYEGDQVAIEILQKIGTSIGQQTAGVILQVGIENEKVPIVIGGRVFSGKSPHLIEAMMREVHKKCQHAYLVKPRYQPVVGAFLYALDELGIIQSVTVEKNLEESEVSL